MPLSLCSSLSRGTAAPSPPALGYMAPSTVTSHVQALPDPGWQPVGSCRPLVPLARRCGALSGPSTPLSRLALYRHGGLEMAASRTLSALQITCYSAKRADQLPPKGFSRPIYTDFLWDRGPPAARVGAPDRSQRSTQRYQRGLRGGPRDVWALCPTPLALPRGTPWRRSAAAAFKT